MARGLTYKTHELKTWPAAFAAMQNGDKTFEFRLDDRGFEVGDTLHLNEWSPESGEYTGLSLVRVITYILRDDFGVPEGYAVLALRKS